MTVNREMEERIINDKFITQIIDDEREVNRANLQGLRYTKSVLRFPWSIIDESGSG